jgi:anti-anti-sigma factor
VFDSSLLKETVTSLVVEGRRNFAIDLSPLDYIYSDAINVILAVNRRILDVSGRLSLLSPIPEVRSILERAGVHNILKIYETETELLKSSEDIILQTTRFNLSELKSYQEPKPKSEFEDFRSTIGAAITTEGPPEPGASFGGEMFESEIVEDAFTLQQPQKRPQSPWIEEPFVPPTPPPPPRQAAHPIEAPPPRKPASVPQKPLPIEQDVFEFQTAPSEPARGKQRPAPSVPSTAAIKRPERDYDRFDAEEDEFDEEKPKRSVVPILAGVVVLVILAVGGYIGYNSFFKNATQKSAPSFPESQASAEKTMPELAQPAQPAEPSAPETTEAEMLSAEAPSIEATEPVKTPSPERRQTARAASTQLRHAARPANRIYINSRPSGATVTVDGRVIGTTPCRWTDPPQGTIMLVLTKSGYNDGTKMLEYSGGNKTEFVALSRMPRESSPSSAYRKAEPTYSRAVEPPPEETEPPPSSRDEEPAPEPEPPPSVTTPASSSSGGGSGEAATIFISSMPPVADVFMDGKLIGKTNISKLNVTAGPHTMKFVKGAIEVVEDMTFKPGDNPSHLVILKKSGM